MVGGDVAPVSRRLRLVWFMMCVGLFLDATACGLERALERITIIRYIAHTYLFLLIMRLGPAASSGGAAVFFLAIGPSERTVARYAQRMNVGKR